MSVRIGPYEITTRFAAGGMGEIWRGRHVEQDIPVAVKVITGPNALQPEYVEEFRREVQAVARLNHPNVVQVFDYGTLPEESGDDDPGLQPGTPYLVMEYASRGSLADADEQLNWRDMKNILMSTLSGLAHAHARGVIHRDIKPGNVLLGSHHESPPRIILTDFGVAHAADRGTRTDAVELTARSTEEATGTPRYMSPEQFMGQWRDYGPATDLYALGVMAYEMACGELPFSGATFMMLAMAHINQDFPALQATVDVPEGYEGWIRRLTEKHPQDRFRSAANAAWALAQLDDSELLFGELSNIAGDTAKDDEDEWDSTDVLPTRIDFAPPEVMRIFQMSRSFREGRYKDVPPLPLTWQEAEPPKAQVSLVGSGLGLFGLRSIPLVGRATERTKLWETFKKVHTQRESHAIVIHGLGGMGKSGIAEWFSNLVDEIGAATVFKATHSATPGLMHGLGWMLNSHFRCAGLTPDDLADRLEELLGRHALEDDSAVERLTELMRSDLKDTGKTTSSFRFTHAEPRYEAIRDVIDTTTPERPVVCWFDDVHWEPDTLDFVKWSLQNSGREDHPRLFVLVVRDEALIERPNAREALEGLLRIANVHSIDLPPLSTEETVELVREHLYLPIELARDVARRSSGSPLFAIQLVEDWVKRGVLEIEGGSFIVRRGESAEVPTDVEALWRSRLDHLVHQLTGVGADTTQKVITAEDAVRSIEIGAALGQDVNIDEWQHACRDAGHDVGIGVVDELVRLRLATRSDEAGFSFINAQFVEMLTDQARDAGRWSGHNMVCARMLTTRYGKEHPGLAQRVGRHFFEANAYQLAVMCLEEGYRRAHGTAEQRDINEINDLLAECYEAMKIDEHDIRWAELGVRRAVPKIYSQDRENFAEGLELLERAEEIARVAGRRRILAGILRAQAWASIHSGKTEGGLEKAREALELTADGGALEASCHRTLGHLLLVDGEIDDAKKHLTQAVELAPDSVHAVWARQQLASAALLENDLEAAEELIERALADAQANAVLLAEAQIYETWAFVAERRNNFELAEERHRRAMAVRASISTDSTLHAKSKEYVARAVLAQGRFEEAQQMLLPMAEELEAGAKGFYTHLDDALLACAAGLDDWDAFEARIESAVTFEDFAPSAVHARGLLAAGRVARDAGRYSLARKVYGRAADLLIEHDLEEHIAESMLDEQDAIEGLEDEVTPVAKVAESETAEASEAAEEREPLDDSSSHFPVSNTEQNEFPDSPSAPFLTAALDEDSDPIEEPDFTGRVQVLSLPVDPAENFGQFDYSDLSDASEGNWDVYEEPSDVDEDDEPEADFVESTFGVFNVADLRQAMEDHTPQPSRPVTGANGLAGAGSSPELAAESSAFDLSEEPASDASDSEASDEGD